MKPSSLPLTALRLKSNCDSKGIPVIITGEHDNGTSRVHEACLYVDCEIIVNIQGDEPLIPPDLIDAVLEPFSNEVHINICTAIKQIKTENQLLDENVVKVVCSKAGFALYFSRYPVPFERNANIKHYKHIGIYAYTKEALNAFIKLGQSDLERAESLEQLRFLENGWNIRVIETDFDSIGVDVPSDIKKVENILNKT